MIAEFGLQIAEFSTSHSAFYIPHSKEVDR